LVRNAGRTIPKAELMQTLWPDTAVEEGNLTQNVFLIRKALGDETEHAVYIQTVPRIGYKFVMPVTCGEIPAVPETVPATPRSRASLWIAAGALMALLIVAAGTILWRTRTVRSPLIQTIAVIPLQNLSGDPAEDPFADGITEALISSLARIHSLDVISRTSMMQYKGSSKSLPEIARELGVDAMVEGSVQRSSGRVRISAQLIRASTDKHLWANEYEGDSSDVLKLQADVARAIAREIQATVTPEEGRMLASTRRVNVAAEDEYFLGMNDFTSSQPFALDNGGRTRTTYAGFSQVRLDQASEHFLRAIRLDPGYAEGFAGQAAVKMRSNDLDGALPLVLNALKLDPTLAEPHRLRADIHYARWEFIEADREYRRAAELNPSSLDASAAYANFLYTTGRFERGAAFAESSLKRHPFADGLLFNYASNLYGAGRYEEAIRYAKRAAEMNPQSIWPPGLLFDLYKETGRFQEALALVADRPESRTSPWYGALLGRAYVLVGRRTEALKILDRLTALGEKAQAPIQMYMFYFELGDRERGFAGLTQRVDRHAADARYIKFAPGLAALHSDPRFQALVARLNIPDLP
jgi:TolB-like protein/Flp pilus assembly protein TadD